MLVDLACKYLVVTDFLLKFINYWKKYLNNKNNRYLKVSDCVPHDLLVANLNAYGLSIDTVTFLYST